MLTMNWLDRIRELDVLFEKEYQGKMRNEKPMTKGQFWFIIGFLIATISAFAFTLSGGDWWVLLIVLGIY